MITTHELSTAMIERMRAWVADCQWRDMDPEEIAELSDGTITRGIDRHYGGGVEQFLRDENFND